MPFKDPEIAKKAKREWAQRNKEKIRTAQLNRYYSLKNNPEFVLKRKEDRKRWYEAHKTQQHAKSHLAHRRLRLRVIAKLGGQCASCGFTDLRALHIDHINGNGSEHRRLRKGNQIMIYYDALKKPEEYQILCANCNTIKSWQQNNYKILEEYAISLGLSWDAAIYLNKR